MTQAETAPDIRRAVAQGIHHCRAGELEDGFRLLQMVAAAEAPHDLPGRYYSFLGYCIAGFEGRYNEGVKLCQKGIELEFFNPENYLNLAQIYLMLSARRKALRAIRDGLKVDPTNQQLIRLRRDLGVRKRPVVPFLHRDHGVNQVLGRWRHRMKQPPAPRESVAADP